MDKNSTTTDEKSANSFKTDLLFGHSPTSNAAPAPLDPGPPRRRKSTISCKCASWTIFTLISLIGAVLAFNFSSALYKTFSDPWSTLYQDPKVPYRPQDVVHPLVDHNQTFDIVATVWLRTDVTQENLEGTEIVNGEVTTDSEAQYDHNSSTGAKRRTLGSRERAIWTGTIFTGLRLRDKRVRTTVNFSVPTEVFKQRDLYAYDLRGSFVLVPTSPSPLDFVSNYSSWLPDSIAYPLSRPLPEDRIRSLGEEVINAYGTFVPLLSFYNVKSKCGFMDNSTVSDFDFDDEGEEEEEEEEEEKVSYKLRLNTNSQAKSRWDFSRQGRPPLHSHPYVKTKTHLLVANMTKLYNRKAYEEAHKKLKGQTMLACGNSLQTVLPNTKSNVSLTQDWTSCTRSYQANGNQEVKVKLAKKNEKTGKQSTEWAYAPYLTVDEGAIGPLDLVPVPVNREDCSRKGEGMVQIVPDEQFMNITWDIMFSGTVPQHLFFAESLTGLPSNYNMTDEDIKHKAKHAELQRTHGVIAGHHHLDNYHPRREWVLVFVGLALSGIQQILEAWYWLSRSSTVGIATLGCTLVSIGNFSHALYMATYQKPGNEMSVATFLWAFLRTLVFQFNSLLILKAVLRAEFRLSAYGIPLVSFARASHAERASQRKELHPSKRLKILAFVVLGCIYWLCYYKHIFLISPRLMQLESRTRFAERVTWLSTIISLPAITLGRLLQVILNFRLRRFAGTFKICSILTVLYYITRIASTAPWLVGDAPQRVGLSVFELNNMVIAIAMAYQALRFPSVTQADEEEDTK